MHIVDGVLSMPVLLGSGVLALAGVGLGLRALDESSIPRAGLLTAAFFSVSLIHIPLGPTSAHLLLTGLMGVLLGWAVFPAICVGLLLQALFFGYGGVTVLGANTLNLALPALLFGLAGRAVLARLRPAALSWWVMPLGALVGAGAFAGSALLVAGSLAASGEGFWAAARLALIAQLPVALIEAVVTAAALRLLWTVRPELLARSARAC
ncbi:MULTISPECIES: cobalt transporter CbiM [unclassified Marichromatium]|uniref:cobalt transporter CbiM n=1 Tax=unclassified Marichromatium TaxID=2618417 RepID=UPI000F41E04C|nr:MULTISPECIES: cobalt transporter CbiM [unclassified Marichromatium]MBO8086651.1 cobalt transporter CbiM [Marichromatium sp.]RNE90572.1 cobalt transporter CbiM [Marichromatium sp. AB31]RNE94025.1 cobalt transporter CbiM [Marichromatium sp. AB32]